MIKMIHQVLCLKTGLSKVILFCSFSAFSAKSFPRSPLWRWWKYLLRYRPHSSLHNIYSELWIEILKWAKKRKKRVLYIYFGKFHITYIVNWSYYFLLYLFREAKCPDSWIIIMSIGTGIKYFKVSLGVSLTGSKILL